MAERVCVVHLTLPHTSLSVSHQTPSSIQQQQGRLMNQREHIQSVHARFLCGRIGKNIRKEEKKKELAVHHRPQRQHPTHHPLLIKHITASFRCWLHAVPI